jgi:hypothetical protein
VTAPANTALPAVTGTPRAGQALNTTPGSWSGSPTTFTIAWLRCDAAGATCAAIAGATAAGYTLGADDVGKRIRSQVTAGNQGGNTAARSLPTAVVAAASTGGTGGSGGGPFGGGVPTPPSLGGQGPDSTAPAVTVAVKRIKLKALRRKGLSVTVTCSEACTIGAELIQRVKRRKQATKAVMLNAGARPLRPAAVPKSRRAPFRARAPLAALTRVIARGRGQLTAAGKTKVTVKLTRQAKKALKGALKLSATLIVTARDDVGNVGSTARKVRVKR